MSAIPASGCYNNQQLRREKENLKRYNSLYKEFHQITINNCNDLTIQKLFLILHSQDFVACLLFRRVTQKMIGCNLDLEGNKSKMVCIKNYWRPKGRKKESKIYWILKEKNVPNIPKFYCGNNVCYKVCRNNVVQKRCNNTVEVYENNVPQKVCKTVPKHKTHSVIHYQMVLD